MPTANPLKKAAASNDAAKRATRDQEVPLVANKTGLPKKVFVLKRAVAKPFPATKGIAKKAEHKSMAFGRGLATFDLGALGVPKPRQGDKAVEVARAAGIITATGSLVRRYR